MPFSDALSLTLFSTYHLALQRCPHCHPANSTLPRKTTVLASLGRRISCVRLGDKRSGGTFTLVNPAPAWSRVPLRLTLIPLKHNCSGLCHVFSRFLRTYLRKRRDILRRHGKRSLLQIRQLRHRPLRWTQCWARGFKSGSLYSRIVKAEEDGVLTKDMSAWAHDIRFDANDERHADLAHTGATAEDAQRCLDFADTLADLLFVLPARVKRGLKQKPAETTRP
jgi:hypothetical protein